MPDKLKHIKGTIIRVTFASDETSFAVLQVDVEGSLMPVVAVGTIPNPVPGQAIELWGKWKKHPEYGRQFQIEDFKASAPKEQTGMIKYLSSELVNGIGPVYAEKIVQRFGAETINIILNNPEKLRNVAGIGKKRAKVIAESVKKAYEEQASLQKLSANLFSHGFGMGTIRRIWRRYGDASVEVVDSNPYILAEEVWGIGFATADKLAQSMGIEQNDPRRIAAGILYTLQRAADDGHCYLPRENLVESAKSILKADNAIVSDVLEQSILVEKVTADDDRIYLPYFHKGEKDVAKLVANLLVTEPKKRIHHSMAESHFNLARRELDVGYTDEQKKAIIGALSSKIFVITGGPGTGKTTIVKAILFGAKEMKWKVRLAAPTGRAAKRLAETTSHRATTIHRLLKFNPGLGRFEMGTANKLKTDMLILDEVSMVDLELFWRTLLALPPETRLLLVGDADQLPSVGPGAVLRDIINSGKIPMVRLSKIMRQDEHGLIVRNAHGIIRGRMPIVRNDARDDFFMLKVDDSETAQEAVIDLVCRRIPEKYKIDPIKDIQVITPMHKGRCGARELNGLLREKLNPNASKTKLPFAPGDKVMQIANNYDLFVFNGEVGVVSAVNENKRLIEVRFAEGNVSYDSSYWAQLQLAYAITVHKSQGSEYPVVVMPLLTEHYIMLVRNLFYTGVTRAKKLFVLVGNDKAVGIAIRNTRQMQRFTALAKKIKAKLQ